MENDIINTFFIPCNKCYECLKQQIKENNKIVIPKKELKKVIVRYFPEYHLIHFYK